MSPLVFGAIIGFGFAIAYELVKHPFRVKQAQALRLSTTKICSFCAEEIKIEAKICRYCASEQVN